MEISYTELIGIIQAAYKLGQENNPISDIIEHCDNSPQEDKVSDDIIDYNDNFDTEFFNAYNTKDLSWFSQEYNVQSCFYHMSKQMVEKTSKILVPHIIEDYKNIFEVPITRQNLRKELFDKVPWINIMFAHYRSMDIMLYRCFDFMVFERKSDSGIMIVYRVLSNKDMQNIRENGWTISEAIQEYQATTSEMKSSVRDVMEL